MWTECKQEVCVLRPVPVYLQTLVLFFVCLDTLCKALGLIWCVIKGSRWGGLDSSRYTREARVWQRRGLYWRFYTPIHSLYSPRHNVWEQSILHMYIKAECILSAWEKFCFQSIHSMDKEMLCVVNKTSV